ncbi:hypothetical protein [Formosa sp. L2A11]|uniref:hypothetical protein n=1 Tax=Formosa sp. L2A11 TaxID=2686363 RepID=UPI00131E65D4|nr:hypothetical protein [Formosa sp. L2A11]
MLIKRVLLFVLLITLHFTSFAQKGNSKNLDLVFFDYCSEQVITPEYEVEVFTKLNYTLITIFVKRGDLISHYVTWLKPDSDTIRIPKIKL